MSLSANELVRAVKQAAVEAGEASKPFALTFGTVVSAEPLQIKVDQKLTLDSQQLLLTNNVRDYHVKLTTCGEGDSYTESEKHVTEKRTGSVSTVVATSGGAGTGQGEFENHDHDYVGDKWWLVHRKLEVGEKVIMMRCNGGQQYIVLDRVEAT